MKEFPPFRLDQKNECIWRGHDRLTLTPKAFDVLEYLVRRAGVIVTQSELLEAVWPETFVQPEIVKTYIRDLRRVLEDNSKEPRFIETLPRRGYRFVAAVRESRTSGPDASVEPAPTIFGRDDELDELGECLHKAVRQDKQIVFISGEAGIGKTALIDVFVQRAGLELPDLRVARGQCVEGYGVQEPYYPMLQAIGQLVRGPDGDAVVSALRAEAPTWLAQFAAFRDIEPQKNTGSIDVTRDRMLREICDVLTTLTAERPLALILEDCHWVDLNPELDWRPCPSPWFIQADSGSELSARRTGPVATSTQDRKGGFGGAPLCREIPVNALSEAAVAGYLAAGGSLTELPEGLAESVYRHSEGNPLFMIAVVERMAALAYITRDERTWKLNVPIEQIEVGVPETLREMIEVQIDGCPQKSETLWKRQRGGCVVHDTFGRRRGGTGRRGFRRPLQSSRSRASPVAECGRA